MLNDLVHNLCPALIEGGAKDSILARLYLSAFGHLAWARSQEHLDTVGHQLLCILHYAHHTHPIDVCGL